MIDKVCLLHSQYNIIRLEWYYMGRTFDIKAICAYNVYTCRVQTTSAGQSMLMLTTYYCKSIQSKVFIIHSILRIKLPLLYSGFQTVKNSPEKILTIL